MLSQLEATNKERQHQATSYDVTTVRRGLSATAQFNETILTRLRSLERVSGSTVLQWSESSDLSADSLLYS